MKFIVGLGNPGKQYEKTRHNIGFIIVDALQKMDFPGMSAWQLSKKFNAMMAGFSTVSGDKVILAKPMTFMNNSGEAVHLIASFYKLAPSDIIIVHDDKDLPLGKIKVHVDRGHAGHNGVRSIMEHIGPLGITRIRVGIATENKKKMDDTADFVLGKFGFTERKQVKMVIEQTIEEIKKLI